MERWIFQELRASKATSLITDNIGNAWEGYQWGQSESEYEPEAHPPIRGRPRVLVRVRQGSLSLPNIGGRIMNGGGVPLFP